MAPKKPKDISEYRVWLEDKSEREKSDVLFAEGWEDEYEYVSNKIQLGFMQASIWKDLMKNLREYDAKYHIQTGYPLFLGESTPQIIVKPFDSFLLKTFRKNVIENRNWPDEPENGWILPENWFSTINDITRSMLIVKYLDGVEFMVSTISDLCSHYNLRDRVFWEARPDGYYSAHLYVTFTLEIPKRPWDTKKIEVTTEIQIITQLQDIILRLLRKYYEGRRKEGRSKDIQWQWDYKNEEFATNYLGHILHYVEGMIMEIRERREGKST